MRPAPTHGVVLEPYAWGSTGKSVRIHIAPAGAPAGFWLDQDHIAAERPNLASAKAFVHRILGPRIVIIEEAMPQNSGALAGVLTGSAKSP